MSASPLSKRLLLKADYTVLLINSQEDYLSLLGTLPEGLRFSTIPDKKYDVILAFVKSAQELNETASLVTKVSTPQTIIWLAYPKKSSGIVTNLSMDSWDLSTYKLNPVASVSINEIWTGIRLKQVSMINRSGVGNNEIRANELGKYIDVDNKTINLPPDFRSELIKDPAVNGFFETLSYSNQKEYLTWVLTAKQEKTRLDRIQKSREKLAMGKKNPAEK